MESRSQFRNGSGWSIALGIGMVLLGIAAIASPVLTSIAAELILGWLFIIGAVIQGFDAFQADRDNGSFWVKLLLSILYLVVGLLLLANPIAGIISLTLFTGIFYFVDGVFRVFLAFRAKPRRRWLWVLLNGILMIVLGILIWSQWPFNAPWVLGVLVGVGLISNGIVMLTFAAANQILD